MPVNSGTDAIAKMSETTSSVGDTVSAAQTAPPTQIFQRGIVVEVLYDPSFYSDEEWSELTQLIDAPELFKSAPRNSVVVRLTTAGSDKRAPDAEPDPVAEGEDDPPVGEEPAPDPDAETDEEKIGQVGILCYPFFPPHLCFPIKPGEQVWVVSDSPDIPSKVLYWMCRIPEPDQIDDPNYTHGDRKFVGGLEEETTKEKSDTASGAESDDEGGEEDLIFGFPNGPGTPDAWTLKDEFGYEDIYNAAAASYSFTPEVVPRFTKRPGDFVVQGSNNTLICMGEERGWTHPDADTAAMMITGGSSADAETSNASKSPELFEAQLAGGFGAIDIVVGRGRWNNQALDGDLEDDPTLTAPRTIETTPPSEDDGGRDANPENCKNPQGKNLAEENRLDAPAEGDPDFETDSARMYMSMASNPDANFHIDTPGETIPTLFDTAAVTEPQDGSADVVGADILDIAVETLSGYGSAIVLKSDQLRIIARKATTDTNSDLPDSAPSINGSIRLIKEGDPTTDLAALLMLPDGTVQISGSRIFLGRHVDDGGMADEGEGDDNGPDGDSQPWMRYTDFVTWANALVLDVQDCLQNVADEVHDLMGQINTASSTGMTGGSQFLIGPNAGLGGAWGTLYGYTTARKGWNPGSFTTAKDLIKDDHDANYPEIPSERIYGE